MLFSTSSLLISILLAIVLIIILQLLISNKIKGQKYQISFLTIFSLIIFLRLAFPFEFINTHTIRSYKILPAIYSFGRTKVTIINLTFTIKQILKIIWLIGTIVMLIIFFRNYHQLSRYAGHLKKIPPNYFKDVSKKSIPHNTKLYYLPINSTPFNIGIFHPKIIFTKLQLSSSQKQIILQHEIQHVKNHDNLKLYLIELLTCVYWWFPFIYIFKKQIREIIEMNVDFQIVHHTSRTFYQSYTKCLIDVYKKISNNQLEDFNSNFVINEDETLKHRIHFLLAEYKIKQTFWLFKIILIILPLALTSIIIEPFYKETEKTKGTFAIDAKNPKNYILKVKNKFYLIIEGKMVAKIPNPKKVKNMKAFQSLPIKTAKVIDDRIPNSKDFIKNK